MAPKRTAEIRLLVAVIVDLTDPELTSILKARPRQPISIAKVVAEEIISNLESVSYVDTTTVGHL